jgi:hypothetical protein
MSTILTTIFLFKKNGSQNKNLNFGINTGNHYYVTYVGIS